MSAPTEEAPQKSAVPIADLSEVDLALRRGGDRLVEAVKKVRPADLGRDLARRTPQKGRRLLEAVDDRRGAAMLRAANPTAAAKVLTACEPQRAAKLLAYLPTDHQVAILGQVDGEARTRVETALAPEQKRLVDRILAFDRDAAGRLMSPKVWTCRPADTVGDAMATLRAAREEIEVAVNCYVTDGGKLVGVIPLRELAISDPATRIDAVMTRDVIAVREDAGRAEAAEIVQTHDFLSLPVVDAQGTLIGAIRVDDLLDAALLNQGTGALNQGGVSGKVVGAIPYFLVPLWKVVRSRLTWLVLLFVAETATGTVLRAFEDELAKVVALSFFVPLLIGTGGNAGAQTVSTIIRALALGEVRTRDVFRVMGREVTVGVLLGALLGGIAFGRALMWGVGPELATCVAITILVVVIWANTVGSLVPVVAQTVGIDPTVVSAPLITTLVDASGLFIYFSVARLTVKALAGS